MKVAQGFEAWADVIKKRQQYCKKDCMRARTSAIAAFALAW
ncbi:hypothetical protein [Paraburkholderia aromaticivorans]